MKFWLSLLLLAASRFGSLPYNIISDCDETYNYWEPTFFLLRSPDPTAPPAEDSAFLGLQTWEHSPAFALRSYAYPYIHALIGKAAHRSLHLYAKLRQRLLLTPIAPYVAHLPSISDYEPNNLPSPSMMLTIRHTICLIFLVAEVCFAFALESRHGDLGAAYCLISATSPGMTLMASQLLPTASFAIFATFAFAAYLRQRYINSCFIGAVAVFLTCPFAGLVFLPLFVSLLLTRRMSKFVQGVGFAVLCVFVQMYLDVRLYGQWSWPSLNILLYNLPSTGGGSELYGTEPWTFYLQNLILNFHIWFPLAIVSVFQISSAAIFRRVQSRFPHTSLIMIAPVVIWIGFMLALPHKEERFLYPVYPLICAAAAGGLLRISRKAQRASKGLWRFSRLILICMVVTLGWLRVYGLYRHYGRAVDLVWSSVRDAGAGTVCLGADWYRYPSSFRLAPDQSVAFLDAGFQGVLPVPFRSSRWVDPRLNDRNERHADSYTKTQECDFLVDSIPSDSKGTPRDVLGIDSSAAALLRCEPILSPESPFPWRSIWTYFLDDAKTWNQYCVWRLTDTAGKMGEGIFGIHIGQVN